jgi:hypothetical protein
MNRTAGLFLAPLLLTGCSLTADTFSCAVKFDGAPDKCIDTAAAGNPTVNVP